MTQNLFIGIEIPELVKSQLHHYRQQQAHLPQLGWVPTNNYHITACFIGKRPDREKVMEQFESFDPNSGAFSLPFRSLCLMPEKSPRMLWAAYEALTPFEQLYQSLHLWMLGTAPARSIARPHITVARAKKASLLRQLPLEGTALQPVMAGSLILWESVPTSNGVRYHALASKKLT